MHAVQGTLYLLTCFDYMSRPYQSPLRFWKSHLECFHTNIPYTSLTAILPQYCIAITARSDNRSSVITDLMYVFNLLNKEKDSSASELVIGRVQPIEIHGTAYREGNKFLETSRSKSFQMIARDSAYHHSITSPSYPLTLVHGCENSNRWHKTEKPLSMTLFTRKMFI